jgi:hypothetical protein
MITNTDILNKCVDQLKDEIDDQILFDMLTIGWHKMEITFNKDRYHQHLEMVRWCQDHVGPGKWTGGSPKTWQGMGDSQWVVHSTFGNTTFAFKDARHYTLFVLRWS